MVSILPACCTPYFLAARKAADHHSCFVLQAGMRKRKRRCLRWPLLGALIRFCICMPVSNVLLWVRSRLRSSPPSSAQVSEPPDVGLHAVSVALLCQLE